MDNLFSTLQVRLKLVDSGKFPPTTLQHPVVFFHVLNSLTLCPVALIMVYMPFSIIETRALSEPADHAKAMVPNLGREREATVADCGTLADGGERRGAPSA